jgi:hypothetical protein
LHYIFPASALDGFVKSAGTPSSLMQNYQDRWDSEQLLEGTEINAVDVNEKNVLGVKETPV